MFSLSNSSVNIKEKVNERWLSSITTLVSNISPIQIQPPLSVFKLQGAEISDMGEVDGDDMRSRATKSGNIYPHGMFFCRTVFELLSNRSGADVPCVCIGRYCNEGHGNNIDGEMVGKHALKGFSL